MLEGLFFSPRRTEIQPSPVELISVLLFAQLHISMSTAEKHLAQATNICLTLHTSSLVFWSHSLFSPCRSKHNPCPPLQCLSHPSPTRRIILFQGSVPTSPALQKHFSDNPSHRTLRWERGSRGGAWISRSIQDQNLITMWIHSSYTHFPAPSLYQTFRSLASTPPSLALRAVWAEKIFWS